MTIHKKNNNLVETNITLEIDEYPQNKIHGNFEEMNPYAVINNTIHSNISNDNTINNNLYIKKNLEKKIKQIKYNRQLYLRKNDIMRSATREKFNNKYNFKSYIKIYKNINTNLPKQRLNIMRSKSSIKVIGNEDLKTNHSFGNFIQKNPEISNFEYVENGKEITSENIHHTPININQDNFKYNSIPLDVVKQKETDLAEIITDVLQEVLIGKLKSIENVIGKIRVNFEEKNLFTNSKKRNIILLNFEDDTMRPVLKIEEKYMNIIKQWYNDCDLLIDIEETNTFIPESITTQDASGVLFKDINYKFKDEYLNDYIPIVINNIICERSIIKGYEKKYFEKSPTQSYPIEIKKYCNSYGVSNHNNQPLLADNILSDMGIIIPENIKPDLLMENTEPVIKKNNEIRFSHWKLPDAGKRIDPEILVKNHILNDVKYINKINENENENEIYPYNEVYDSSKPNKIDYSDKEKLISCYNSEYNTLKTNFGDDYLIIENIDDIENNIETNISTIIVLINDKFLQTLTIENPSVDIMYIIKNHSEFGFIKLLGIKTNNNDIVKFIEREFNEVHFNDVDEVNKKLLVTSQYIEFSNKHNGTNNISSTEETQVKKFLDKNYNIDDDINHKMKASTLYDIIITSKVVKIENDKLSGFKTRLSKYLKDIGLKKKRYNDGFYYYGIVKKENKFLTPCNKQVISLEEIIKRRDEEKSNYMYNENHTFLGLNTKQIEECKHKFSKF